MEILLLSRYENLGSSSRYRFYQYLPYLRKKKIEITVAPLFDNNYIKDLYAGRKKNFVKITQSSFYQNTVDQFLFDVFLLILSSICFYQIYS